MSEDSHAAIQTRPPVKPGEIPTGGYTGRWVLDRVLMHGRKLVLEAASPQAVAMLRYGTTGLTHRLNAQLGDDVVSEVVVKPPSRQSG